MRVVIQKVSSASVSVSGNVIGDISDGLLIYIAVSNDFEAFKLDKMVNKISSLRIWPKNFDDTNGFKLNVNEFGGDILVISQFTLFGDLSSGTKPNFKNSMAFDDAKKIYDDFVSKLKEKNPSIRVETGEFGAFMDIESVNCGPVTLIYDI